MAIKKKGKKVTNKPEYGEEVSDEQVEIVPGNGRGFADRYVDDDDRSIFAISATRNIGYLRAQRFQNADRPATADGCSVAVVAVEHGFSK